MKFRRGRRIPSGRRDHCSGVRISRSTPSSAVSVSWIRRVSPSISRAVAREGARCLVSAHPSSGRVSGARSPGANTVSGATLVESDVPPAQAAGTAPGDSWYSAQSGDGTRSPRQSRSRRVEPSSPNSDASGASGRSPRNSPAPPYTYEHRGAVLHQRGTRHRRASQLRGGAASQCRDTSTAAPSRGGRDAPAGAAREIAGHGKRRRPELTRRPPR